MGTAEGGDAGGKYVRERSDVGLEGGISGRNGWEGDEVGPKMSSGLRIVVSLEGKVAEPAPQDGLFGRTGPEYNPSSGEYCSQAITGMLKRITAMLGEVKMKGSPESDKRPTWSGIGGNGKFFSNPLFIKFKIKSI